MDLPIVYQDRRVLVTVKPAGVLSTNESGGMPELLRATLGDPAACVRTVHRLDQVVGGLMVFARSAVAASELSRQVRERRFEKAYLAVVHGCPAEQAGVLRDYLQRSRQTRLTTVAAAPGKDAREAELSYRVLSSKDGLSLLLIHLKTGRTHQIRVQFASRALPLVGDRKYGREGDGCEIALWSCKIGFFHPETGKWMSFTQAPPDQFPWNTFSPAYFDSDSLEN